MAVAISSSTANLTFSNTMSLGAADLMITIGANGTYTLGGVIQGGSGAGLTIDALSCTTGNIALNNANTYSGDTTINGGTVNLGNAAALGTAGLNVNAGTLNLLDGATHSITTFHTGGTIQRLQYRAQVSTLAPLIQTRPTADF